MLPSALIGTADASAPAPTVTDVLGVQVTADPKHVSKIAGMPASFWPTAI
jgi:hypothetical protein